MSGSLQFSAIDQRLMAQALRLAELGRYTARPNPVVGCVIAHGEQVIGQGWHARAGEPHAEVFALREAGERARGASVYVTLEPCGLHGRTPPCADALIAAGVARVLIAAADPNQRSGGAVARMRAAGIEVQQGLQEAAARQQNSGFFSRIERGRPWLRVKLAMSLDGRTALADGSSKWITSDASRDDVQRFRARSCAILTGSGTALADDPKLTVRLPTDVAGEWAAPLRIVLDRRGDLPTQLALFSDRAAQTLRVCAEGVQPAAIAGVELLQVPETKDGLDLSALMRSLAARGINEVQVEAGPTLAGVLLRVGLVDEWLIYQAPVLLGERGRALVGGLDPGGMADRVGLQLRECRQIGPDLRLRLE